MTDAAKEERRQYLREWRSKNPDKMKQYRENYWEKRKTQTEIPPKERERQVNEEIELESSFAVIQIPTYAVEVTISAKVYVNGKLKTVSQLLDMKAIRDAVEEANKNYIPADAVFTLTEKGREEAEGMVL